MLAVNLFSQNEVRVRGVVVRGHPSCRCQKQPWTKITFFRPGKQMSGVPGRVTTVEPVTVAEGVQKPPDGYFRPGVLAANARHVGASFR